MCVYVCARYNLHIVLPDVSAEIVFRDKRTRLDECHNQATVIYLYRGLSGNLVFLIARDDKRLTYTHRSRHLRPSVGVDALPIADKLVRPKLETGSGSRCVLQ